MVFAINIASNIIANLQHSLDISQDNVNERLVSTQATAVDGRSGTVRNDDGLIDLQLAMPTWLGGKGGAANPEQLCGPLCNAVIQVTRNREKRIRDNEVEVTARAGLSPNGRERMEFGGAKAFHDGRTSLGHMLN